ncbi:unnamed protein product, partial [Laminaria digitata]
ASAVLTAASAIPEYASSPEYVPRSSFLRWVDNRSNSSHNRGGSSPRRRRSELAAGSPPLTSAVATVSRSSRTRGRAGTRTGSTPPQSSRVLRSPPRRGYEGRVRRQASISYLPLSPRTYRLRRTSSAGKLPTSEGSRGSKMWGGVPSESLDDPDGEGCGDGGMS